MIHLAPILFLFLAHEYSLVTCRDLYFDPNSIVHPYGLKMLTRAHSYIKFNNGETLDYCLDTAEQKVVETYSNKLVMLVKRRLNRN